MKILFLSVIYLQCILLLYMVVKLTRINNGLSRALRGLISSGIVACVVYSFNSFYLPLPASHIFYGLYYCSVTLIMVHFVAFVSEYTNIKSGRKVLAIAGYGSAIADICILLGLSVTRKLITPELTPLDNDYMWIAVTTHWYFNVHLALNYLYIIGILSVFAIKMSLTSRQQRSKFLIVVLGLGLIVIINGLYLISGWKLDISLFGYGLLSLILYFFSFAYVPKDLINVALANALSDMQGILVCFDMDNNCVYYNDTAKKYLTEIHNVTSNYKYFCYNYFERWTSEHPSFFTTEDEAVVRTVSMNIQGEDHTFEVKAKKSFDSKGLYLGCYFNIIDRTPEFREMAQREKMNRIDPLSGYLRREYFFDQVRNIILQNPDKEYYLTCSNIVDFKIFNSIYGEEQGNLVLMKCAKIIEAADTKMELYGRISGDLFGFLLEKENFNERVFHMFISNLQEEFSNSFYKMHIQYGLYPITNRNEPISSMCEKVTLTMKSHKTEYDRIIFHYNEDDLGIPLTEKKLIGRFEHALESGEITMFLQAQFSTAGTLKGAEALVRWLEPDGTIISPETFVPLLERNGLISRVDKTMWRLAVEQLSRWAFMGREDLTISINISVKDFYYLDLYQELTALVEEYQISPKNLCLEITETAIIQDAENVNAILQRLRNYGFPVEIDDFGSGYSSLGLLKDISVDCLKLDMSFLRMMDDTKEERAWVIIEEILNLAQKLEMSTIVEGVEKREQVERLNRLGCDCFQGFYFSMPEPLEYFDKRLDA